MIAGSRLDFLEALELLAATTPRWSSRSCCATCRSWIPDIASLLDIPVGTVKSRIHSARQIVQPLLTR